MRVIIILIVLLSIFWGCGTSSKEESHSESLPSDFNYEDYWINNPEVQSVCEKIDTLCLQEHWLSMGNDNELNYVHHVQLPEDFDHTAYWELNSSVQDSCARTDTLCIESHWESLGRDSGLQYKYTDISSASSPSSSSVAPSSSSASTPSSSSVAPSSSSDTTPSSSSVAQTVATPIVNVPAGSYYTTFSVKITTSTVGATIYYTTDGTDPTLSSNVYTGSISVKNSQVIKAFAVLTGMNSSDIMSAQYTIVAHTCTYDANAQTLTCPEKVYATTTINNVVWMAENMQFPVGGSCYDNLPANCTTYGRLYDGYDAKTSCPTGWRLSSLGDWKNLQTYVDNNNGSATPVTSLKAQSSLWPTPGTDDFGFAALPGGMGGSGDYAIQQAGFWWTSSSDANSNNYRISLYDAEKTILYEAKVSSYRYSVRCVKNSP